MRSAGCGKRLRRHAPGLAGGFPWRTLRSQEQLLAWLHAEADIREVSATCWKATCESVCVAIRGEPKRCFAGMMAGWIVSGQSRVMLTGHQVLLRLGQRGRGDAKLVGRGGFGGSVSEADAVSAQGNAWRPVLRFVYAS